MPSLETLTTMQTAVRANLVSVQPEQLADVNLTQAIRESLRGVDRDRPLSRVAKIAGAGSRYYDLDTIIDDWDADWSRITKIVYPAPDIEEDERIEILSSRDYRIYDDGTTKYLRFESAPSSNEFFVVAYTRPRSLVGLDGATATTLETNFVNALTYISTATACYQLSTRYAGFKDPQFDASFVNFGTKSDQYRRDGEMWMKRYMVEIGTGMANQPAASAWGEYQVGSRLGAWTTHNGVRF